MGLLTNDEYRAIAGGLDLPTGAFIDGGFRPAVSGRGFTFRNRAPGEILAGSAACEARNDADEAVT